MKRSLSSAIAVVTLMVGPPVLAAGGEDVYLKDCAVCHNSLKPKLGDKAAWSPLIAQSEDALVAAVIRGKGAMPPRAGKPALSDGDIKAAVEYMESKVR